MNTPENKENEIYRHIAQALAGRYEVIYYVDIVTNEYIEYASSEKYSKLDVGKHGVDFFAETQKNMKRDIYSEDYPMMAESMEKSNLLNNLAKTGKVFLTYRLILDGRPQYMVLNVICHKEDKNHIIVAVDNIDATKQKELAFERVIGSTMDMATKDVMTGVKNKQAYVQAEMQLNDQMQNDENLEFAIVICDLNGLKQVNDELGHSAGDEFIRSGCDIVCKTFSHSPVFRIGGDEFAVILKGSDFEERHNLLNRLGAIQIINKEKGLVTLAFGMADYIWDKDDTVQDVFERADNLMYENKRNFKQGKYYVIQGMQEKAKADNQEYDKDSDLKFHILFEQLVSAMTIIGKTDIPQIENTYIELSKLFRLSKIVTRVYRNIQEEKEGGGETLSCYDTGEEGILVNSLRVVTSVMSVVTTAVYMSPNEKPLTEEEKWKVELVMRTTLSFVSRNRLKDIVEELAFYDEAGYPNIRSYNQYIMKLVGQGRIHGCLAFRYNLRHFSIINEEYGREIGDRILKLHSDAVKRILGKESFVSRLGGDNFVGIGPADRLERIKNFLIEGRVSFDRTNSVNIQTRAGIFCIPDDFEVKSPSDILTKIINAYSMSRVGEKKSVVLYDDNMLKKRQRSMLIQQLLPDALTNHEFEAYYQPKVDIISGELKGAEALCRWYHEGKMVLPCDFIPMLEETSDICRLDLYMLERVCSDIRRWFDEGKKPVRISVNFSRKHMMNDGLPAAIAEIVDRYSIPHDYIEIELTETTTEVEFGDLKRIATRLHELGFSISVDDFGVGFSSLNLIREIPWNVVKIDRSFLPVENENDSSSKILFKHVVSITKQLGLDCIAEGVETEQHIKLLKENDCDFAQGYYFDKPLEVNEFEKRLLSRVYKV